MTANPDRTLEEKYLMAVARNEIEYLRRLYGKATDALGRVEDEAAADYGRSTFHRIFTPDAAVRVTGGPQGLTGSGPGSWADVVVNALKDYEFTQHLIGTQVVDFEAIQFEGSDIMSGSALMSSYLQAWHAWPDRRLRVVLGTYHDKVRFSPESGWQIYDMTLEYASVEHRMMGSAT